MKNEEYALDIPGMTRARRQLITTMTRAEAAAGSKAWKQHAKLCRAEGITPTPFCNWLAEWLECRRADQERPMPADRVDEGRHDSRDYARMFNGLGE